MHLAVMQPIKVNTPFGECYPVFQHYSDRFGADQGRLAVQLIDCSDGSPVLMATVNLPDQALAPGHVFVKSWSENRGVDRMLIDAGLIGPALAYVPLGHATASVHELLIKPFTPDACEEWNAAVYAEIDKTRTAVVL
jgi:hypothetical protein